MKQEGRKKVTLIFSLALALVVALFVLGVLKTNAYNRARHHETFTGPGLFSPDETHASAVSVEAVPRSGTWSKAFDLNGEGISEHNYQAFTYDFTVTNNTKDEVEDFLFTLTFDRPVFLLSAWNGALECHQHVGDGEIVDTVPDLREFDPAAHTLETVTFDGESLIVMRAGDFLVYHPSSSMNAMEVPIEPFEATTPGIILYVAIGEDISGSVLELEYTYHRLLKSEPLFWISLAGLLLWLIAVLVHAITSAQIRKYQVLHERDNVIINESIETFTGFIDAKDPYTNGHSKRVAIYTRLIAKELGYEGEELDRIYYVALLHDCGKIGVPDNILGKPDRLTEEEFAVMKTHTVCGGKVLNNFKSLKNVGEGALYHHERYDGKGYPEGRSGEDIPLIARMICVADSFDAMNTDRVYRKRLSRERIIEELETNKGRQFDPMVADVMLTILREGKLGGENGSETKERLPDGGGVLDTDANMRLIMNISINKTFLAA